MANSRELEALRKISLKRSACPVASTLDIIGDKWTLLIVRDLAFGKTRYNEFRRSDEDIPTNVLADRLRRLESAGLITRKPYQEKPVRYAYRLTKTGKSLGSLVAEMAKWGQMNIPGARRLSGSDDSVQR